MARRTVREEELQDHDYIEEPEAKRPIHFCNHEVREELTHLFSTTRDADTWLTTPSSYFDGIRPIDIITLEIGGQDRVMEALDYLAAGGPI